MAEKYAPIFDAIQKRNIEGYNSGNVEFAAEMFDNHAVVVDKSNNTSYYGPDQIKNMVESFTKMGKIDFKTPRRVFHDVGDDRFHVDVDFETTILATGDVMRGSFEQLYHKKGDQWKCVYECFEMK